MSNTQAAGWKFWREWVLACIIGGVVGFIAGVPIFVVQHRTVLGIVMGWTVIGVFWGIAQYLVLHQHLSKTNASWVLASVVGVLISLATAQPIFAYLGRNIGWAAIGAVGSIVQYLVLRQHLLWANRWILANAVGVAIGMAVGEALSRTVARHVISLGGGPASGDHALSEAAAAMENLVGGFAGLAVGGTVGLAIYGVITGGVLAWLLRHPKVTEHD